MSNQPPRYDGKARMYADEKYKRAMAHLETDPLCRDNGTGPCSGGVCQCNVETDPHAAECGLFMDPMKGTCDCRDLGTDRCTCGHERLDHEMFGLCEGHSWTGVACKCLRFETDPDPWEEAAREWARTRFPVPQPACVVLFPMRPLWIGTHEGVTA